MIICKCIVKTFFLFQLHLILGAHFDLPTDHMMVFSWRQSMEGHLWRDQYLPTCSELFRKHSMLNGGAIFFF